MPRQLICKFDFSSGYASDMPATTPTQFMRYGSQNVMVTGSGLLRPFRGLTESVTPIGSRVNFLTDNSYAGLGDHDTPGAGSVAKMLDLLFFVGTGPLAVRGVPIDLGAGIIQATSQLQYLTRNAGAFDAGSLAYDVGHAQPSKPDIYLKSPASAGQKTMNASITVCIWRADSNTGQPSRPSPPSDILQAANGSVIVVFPAADSNGQDVWGIGVTIPGLADLGNLYQLPTELGGEVLESTLAYSRVITGTIDVDASIPDGSNTVTLSNTPTPALSAADIGRRITFGTFDSWITEILTPLTFSVNDTNTTGSTITDTATVTHAIDGILRAVEISWADTDLAGQPLAPFDAWTPPDAAFAGSLMDTFYLEDLEGTIFYSIPNYLSFPRTRRIFTEDVATVYIDTGNGFHWRIAKQSIAQLYYVGGSRPIQAQLKSKNVGCKFPQNACLGYNGRLMLWSGRPALVDMDGSMNSTFYMNIASTLDGWEDQAVGSPVVPAYDPIGQYELWCYGSTIMAMHAPTGRWCSPIDITEWSTGSIQGQVIVDEKLYLVIKEGTELKHYAWDDGLGSIITIQSYFRQTPQLGTTISLVRSVAKPGTAGDTRLEHYLIKNFEHEISIGTAILPTTPSTQTIRKFKPDVRGCEEVAIKIIGTGATNVDPVDGTAAVDWVELWGEWDEVGLATR